MIINFFINTILKPLSYYKDNLIQIFFEEKDLKIYLKILKNKKFIRELIFFLVIVFILELLFFSIKKKHTVLNNILK